MARTYTKHNQDYWNNRKVKPAATAGAPITINTVPQGEKVEVTPFPEVAYGGCGAESTASTRGNQSNNGLPDPDAFQNLRGLPLPYGGFNNTRTYVGMSNTIDLCARAWAGIPVARNAIEVSVEFSNQPLWIKCQNQTVKKFFTEWFNALRINKLKQQFFREYYRSGNVFLMTFLGKFGAAYYKNFQQSFSAKANKIPIRYELLSPMNVFVPTGVAAPYTYVRLLSTYEVERLKNPLTEQDRQVYNSLPQIAKDQITNSGANPLGIYIPLDTERLRYAFYKKQDYEPLAVPMIWPVLPDIEWKLTLKKMDKALAQNVEHVLLLVTTGEAPNQYNGGKGLNQNNINNLRAMLMNQAVNRVIVADYSTKAQWLVPDMSGLNPEKYTIVNEDIREGLQSILTGDDKFANAQIKAKIFIQRLEEGQAEFLNFLMTEIMNICDNMGFRTIPEVGFRKINLQDETVMARIYAQLGQLGVLTAPQTVQAIETSILPDEDEMDSAQTKYVKDREDGKFLPLVGGTQKEDDAGQVGGGGRPAGTKAPKTSSKPGPIGTSRGSVNDANTPRFSMKAMVDTLRDRSNLEEFVNGELKRAYKIKGEFNDTQKSAAASLTFSIMASNPREKWDKNTAKAAVKNPPAVGTTVMEELDEIRGEYSLGNAFEAIVMKHARL